MFCLGAKVLDRFLFFTAEFTYFCYFLIAVISVIAVHHSLPTKENLINWFYLVRPVGCRNVECGEGEGKRGHVPQIAGNLGSRFTKMVNLTST